MIDVCEFALMNAISPFFLLNLLLDLWDITKSGFHLRRTALTVKTKAPPTFCTNLLFARNSQSEESWLRLIT